MIPLLRVIAIGLEKTIPLNKCSLDPPLLPSFETVWRSAFLLLPLDTKRQFRNKSHKSCLIVTCHDEPQGCSFPYSQPCRNDGFISKKIVPFVSVKNRKKERRPHGHGGSCSPCILFGGVPAAVETGRISTCYCFASVCI